MNYKIGGFTGQKKKGTSSESIYKFNSNVVFVAILLLGLGIILQMGRWQILEKERFTSLANSQYIDNQRQASSRGIIYASDGTVLATDQPAWDVYASLSSLPDERTDFFNEKDKYITTVSSILGLESDFIDKKLTKEFRYFKLAQNVDSDQKKALESARIFTDVKNDGSYKRGLGFGFHFVKSEKRIYPNGDLASQVLGFMGKDDDGNDSGVYGIEGYYFGDLVGTEGYTYEEQDAQGNVILTSEYEPVLPREGKDITLTIKPGIQRKVQDHLKKGVDTHQAKSGSAIVMDPKTGAIIAMANYPAYDGNEYWRTQEVEVFKNKAIADVYEPGSVFKPITVAIGLESGAITPTTTCNDETGFITIFEGTQDETQIYTWDRKPDGLMVPEEFLQNSNNPCIATTALAIGHEYYYPKMKEFGIGEFIGMGLQDEANSYLMPYESWTKLDLATTSFGQSVSTTPLQMISAISTIANDGKRMKPYIVKSVSDDDEEIKYSPQILATPISEETADKVAIMLRSVVEKGDARAPFRKILETYDVAGKTGTAQIPFKDKVGYDPNSTNTTFIGFAPVEDPVFIMLVRIEEPSLGTFSSETVVPVWADIFTAIADDLEVPKKK